PLIYKISLNSNPTSTTGTIEPQSEKKAAKKTNPKKNKKSKPTGATPFSKAGIQNNRFSAAFDTGKWGSQGIARITFVFEDSNTTAKGFLVHPNGSRVAASLTRMKPVQPQSSSTQQQPNPVAGNPPPPKQATFPINFPLGAHGRQANPKMERVLIQNVTIWTCSDQGVIPNGSVLFEQGKITAVGAEITVQNPKNLVTLDGKGMHLTPGIIDCHSHMASDGGINESGQAITAEVRIGDFINCNDINIYRQLAGGVTTSNILHGSANPIGGQNQVIKLRWGMNDEEMKFAAAPQGIKFALGENVKRSRTRDSTRYPKTRMGVEQIFMDEFRAARGYQQAWKKWQQTRTGMPPRRDLELDAIVEILNQKRWIHCHSYRQDEILALIRLLDGFNIQIGTFQHILEGYKVADAMKRHGAMGSAFSDWWAYKFEVYDAIPYAGALMHNAGVVVSFNSDDRELARHLNHEAAKAVKYGGIPPHEALQFVTLNPAKQLRIDQYVGSIEIGKHADIVLWNGDPLSTMSRCEKTWVDGRRMFDRDNDLKQRGVYETMKQKLIQKILTSNEKMNSLPHGRQPKPEEMWPQWDEFCKCKGKK
ncbi:MAG: amidohydrolase, partial [Planctomycetota bacterium]|nr:amidohydrolase [Planctomycetota bacterium]